MEFLAHPISIMEVLELGMGFLVMRLLLWKVNKSFYIHSAVLQH